MISFIKFILIPFFLVVFSPLTASASLKFCSFWDTIYIDSGFGEDFYTGPSGGLVRRPAAYSQYYLYNVTDGSYTNGYLDSNGCTPYLPYVKSKVYQFSQGTKVSRNNRTIFVQSDDSSWQDNSVVWFSYVWVSPSTISSNRYYSINNPLILLHPKANIMPIAGRIVANYSTFAYPDGATIAVNTNKAKCPHDGAYTLSYDQVCVVADSSYAWGDCTRWKYTIAHEFGHAIADRHAGSNLFGGTYSHDVSEPKCRCDHIANYGSTTSHCLQSREYAQPAQAEGFANFVSSAVFNARVENDGVYVHAKPIWKKVNGVWRNDIMPPNAWLAYPANTLYDRWMENQCDPGDQALGVELDWMHFFYETWTTGNDYKLTIRQLTNIWNDVTDPESGWDNATNKIGIRKACENRWGEEHPKSVIFRDAAEVAGVDHG